MRSSARGRTSSIRHVRKREPAGDPDKPVTQLLCQHLLAPQVSGLRLRQVGRAPTGGVGSHRSSRILSCVSAARRCSRFVWVPKDACGEERRRHAPDTTSPAWCTTPMPAASTPRSGIRPRRDRERVLQGRARLLGRALARRGRPRTRDAGLGRLVQPRQDPLVLEVRHSSRGRG